MKELVLKFRQAKNATVCYWYEYGMIVDTVTVICFKQYNLKWLWEATGSFACRGI
jgi:hypothetical protein